MINYSKYFQFFQLFIYFLHNDDLKFFIKIYFKFPKIVNILYSMVYLVSIKLFCKDHMRKQKFQYLLVPFKNHLIIIKILFFYELNNNSLNTFDLNFNFNYIIIIKNHDHNQAMYWDHKNYMINFYYLHYFSRNYVFCTDIYYILDNTSFYILREQYLNLLGLFILWLLVCQNIFWVHFLYFKNK